MHRAPAHPNFSPQFPRRPIGVSGTALVALALTLLTGLVISQLALLARASYETAPVRSSEATRIGLTFYDAVENYLSTGQASELQRVVHPDFVSHVDGEPAISGYQALLEQLQSLGTFVAGGHLDVTPSSSSGDLVQFAVSVPPIADTVVLGLTAAQSEGAVFNDILRVADGRIAERWSTLQPPVEFTPLASLTSDPPPAAQILPAVKRITMLSGSSLTLNVGTSHIVLVEQGALTIVAAPREAATTVYAALMESPDLAESTPTVAMPGSAVTAESTGPYQIVNDGASVASALLFRIAAFSGPNGASVSSTSQDDPGVQIETLSWAPAIPNHMGDWRVEIGRATLRPGMTIPAHDVVGSELVVVESGVLDANLGPCEQGCILTNAGVEANSSGHTQVGAGAGISANHGAQTAYRVMGDEAATLLILTIAPVRA